ncbi:MAG: membrane protein insertase YidC [Nitrospinota bacterium]
MDSKTVTAIALAMLVLVGWNVWYYYRYKDVMERNRLERLEQKQQEAAGTPQETGKKPPATEQLQIEAKPPAPLETVPLSPFESEPAEQAKVTGDDLITVNTGVTEVTLSKVGGVIHSLKLTKFAKPDGEPVELVNQGAKYGPLAVGFATREATAKINSARFATSSPSRITLTDTEPDRTVTFGFKLESGFELVKKVTFHRNSYRIDLETVVTQPGGGASASSYGLSWPGMGDGMDSKYSYEGPVTMVDGKRLTEKPDEGEKQSYEGQVKWAGLTSKYYCVAFFPESETSKVTNTLIGEKKYSATLEMVAAGNRSVNRVAIYAGPKIRGELGKMGSDFKNIINYGWFDIIAKPLFILMLWFYGVIGNWGWSIIIVTILIKVLFFPLSQKSYKSMKKMQKLQPQMKILQERYKNDKEKLNQELMATYKKHNVNPLGGCLPMFLQIPVFIGLYRVLLQSIELKGAPFIFWLTDLSAKDPYYVTPILMGLSMLAQQKLSPSSADPIQKNMMLLMPVVFTVMFLNFPSGLVVYWLTSNILSILQQYYINRSHRYEVA